ncbi:MAG: chemotaxis protein CheW [Chromatiales bacterium]|nr:chemotaxis protein CheW [Chromatiales bacterium]
MAAPQLDPLALLQQDAGAQPPHRAGPARAGAGGAAVVGSRVSVSPICRLVTPLDHVSEVLPPPAVTPVPGTKKWLKGIANVRGTLVTHHRPGAVLRQGSGAHR